MTNSYTNIKKLIPTDTYWGEFSEEQIDELLIICEKKGLEAARLYVKETLNREDFIFGVARSGFLYYLDLDKNSVCLDCGCGLGVHTFNMARQAKEVHAFDQSLKRLQFIDCKRRAEGIKNIHLYQSDFSHLSFKENMFDAIIMNGVVEWLGEINEHKNPRDDQIAVLRQMRRLLKPGGKLYIGIENRWAAAYLRGYDHNGIRFTNFFPRFLADIATKSKKGKPYRTYTYGATGYRKLLNDSGFSSQSADFYIAHPGYNLPQYLIAFDDIPALRFFYTSFGKRAGFGRKFIYLCAKYSTLSLRILRRIVWSYAIIVKK